jgi:hypothetical protein
MPRTGHTGTPMQGERLSRKQLREREQREALWLSRKHGRVVKTVSTDGISPQIQELLDRKKKPFL